MRQLAIFILYCTLTAFNCTKTSAENELNGTWVPVKQEMNGTLFPDSALLNQQLIIKDSMYTVIIMNATDKGTINYDGNHIDITSKEGVNNGKHFTAIYKLENDQLVICYNLAGDSYPEKFETIDHPTYFLSVFRRK
jgi:uncharacterized protein (TIGR03067 family)